MAKIRVTGGKRGRQNLDLFMMNKSVRMTDCLDSVSYFNLEIEKLMILD